MMEWRISSEELSARIVAPINLVRREVYRAFQLGSRVEVPWNGQGFPGPDPATGSYPAASYDRSIDSKPSQISGLYDEAGPDSFVYSSVNPLAARESPFTETHLRQATQAHSEDPAQSSFPSPLATNDAGSPVSFPASGAGPGGPSDVPSVHWQEPAAPTSTDNSMPLARSSGSLGTPETHRETKGVITVQRHSKHSESQSKPIGPPPSGRRNPGLDGLLSGSSPTHRPGTGATPVSSPEARTPGPFAPTQPEVRKALKNVSQAMGSSLEQAQQLTIATLEANSASWDRPRCFHGGHQPVIVQNTFNVTVSLNGRKGPGGLDRQEIEEALVRVLSDTARRHGLEV